MMAVSSLRRHLVIFIIDLFIALAVFYLFRYVVHFPKWYWLCLSGVVWAWIGLVTHKLEFDRYRKESFVTVAVISVNIVTYLLIFEIWRLLSLRESFTWVHLMPVVVMTPLELLFSHEYRKLAQKRIPYLYEEIISSEKAEPSSVRGVRIQQGTVDSPDLFRFMDLSFRMHSREMVKYVREHPDDYGEGTLITLSDAPEKEICGHNGTPDLIVVLESLNDVRHVNTMLAEANRRLAPKGIISMHCTTSGLRKERILEGNPALLNHVIFFFDYIWSRVFVKLSVTRPLYMFFTGGKGRNFPRVEVMGRVARAGFTIIDDQIRNGEYYLTAVKTSEPVTTDRPSYGPLIRLMRVGYQGQIIGVYKFRTMYAYSEYLQSYVYQQSGLRDGGKLKDDFRINFWGRLLRPVWLDEFPMVINWIRGDMKLVGVRPLSRQYYSLYSPWMQEYRTKVRPGLIPPFYYEKYPPRTLEEVQESEKRYIEAYLKSPLKTDIRYFFGILWNICFRKERSH